jgi:hypothetical protein
LGAKAKKILLCDKGVKDGAIGVFKGHDKREEGIREEEEEMFNPGEELHDAKAAIEGIITKKGLVACFLGISQGNLGDSSGYGINEHLVPLDIRIGG